MGACCPSVILPLTICPLRIAIESYNSSLPLGDPQNGMLWFYGDSLAVRLANSVRSRLLCTRLYMQCQRSYNYNYPKGHLKDDDLDFMPDKVIESILRVLRKPQMQKEGSALLVNLGIHFSISINFTTYQRLIVDLTHRLKETEVDSKGKMVLKFRAKVIWKTSTAIHKEKSGMKNKTCWRSFTTQVKMKVFFLRPSYLLGT